MLHLKSNQAEMESQASKKMNEAHPRCHGQSLYLAHSNNALFQTPYRGNLYEVSQNIEAVRQSGSQLDDQQVYIKLTITGL